MNTKETPQISPMTGQDITPPPDIVVNDGSNNIITKQKKTNQWDVDANGDLKVPHYPENIIKKAPPATPVPPATNVVIPKPTNPDDIYAPLNVDVYKSYLSGMKLDDIAKNLKPEDTILPLHDFEYYWKHYGEPNGMDKAKMEKEYSNIKAINNNFQNFKYHDLLHPIGSEVVGVGAGSPIYATNGLSFPVVTNIRFYNPFGMDNHIMLRSKEDIARSKPYFYTYDVAKDPETGEEKYVGHRKVFGRMPHKFMAGNNYYVVEETDDNGKPVVDKDGNLSYVYMANDPYTPRYDAEKASFMGGGHAFGQAWWNIGASIQNGVMDALQGIPQMIQGQSDILINNAYALATVNASSIPGSMSLNETAQNASMAYIHSLSATPEEKEKMLEPIHKAYNEHVGKTMDNLIDITESLKYRYSDEFNRNPVGALSFATQVGQLVGFLTPGIVLSAATGALGAPAELTSLASSLLNTSAFANSAYRMARADLGDSPNAKYNAALFATLFSAGVMASDQVLSAGWLTKGFSNKTKLMIKNRLGEVVGEYKARGANLEEPTTMFKIIKKTFKGLGDNKEFLEQNLGKGMYVASDVLKSSLHGAANLGMITTWQEFMEQVYDAGQKWNMLYKPTEKQFNKPGIFTGEGAKRILSSAWFGAWSAGLMRGIGLTKPGSLEQYQKTIFEREVARGNGAELMDYLLRLHQEGRTGRDYADVDRREMTLDDEENMKGNTFTVDNDLIFDDGKRKVKIFSKGDMLKTEGEMNLYNLAHDLILTQNIVNMYDLRNPKLLYGLMSDRLVEEGIRIGKSINDKTIEIKTLQSEKAKVVEGKGDTKEIDGRIQALEEEINGVVDENGNIIKRGLNHEMDYIRKPLYQSSIGNGYFSEAARDNWVHAAVNGYLIKEGTKNGRIKGNIMQYTKAMAIDNFGWIKFIRSIREGEKQKILENAPKQKTLYGNFTKALTDAISSIGKGKESFIPARDNLVSLKNELINDINENGASLETLNKITGEVPGLFDKYSTELLKVFKEKAPEDKQAEIEALGLDSAIMTVQGSLKEGDKYLADVYNSLLNIADFSKGAEGQKVNNYNEDYDSKIISQAIFSMPYNKGNVKEGAKVNKEKNEQQYISILDAIKNLKDRKNLDDPTVVDELVLIGLHLNLSKQRIDFADSWDNTRNTVNKDRSDPGITVMDNEEPTTVADDGEVIPGTDIPRKDIDHAYKDYKQAQDDLNELNKKYGIDIQDKAKVERRKRVVTYVNRYHMLTYFTEMNGAFSFLNKDMEELNKFMDLYHNNSNDLKDKDLKMFSQLVRDVEDKVYDRAKSNPKLKEQTLMSMTKDLGSGNDSLAAANRSYFEDKTGQIQAVNSVDMISLASYDPKFFREIRHLSAVNYINNITAVRSSDFYGRLFDMAKAEGMKVPGVEQINAIRTTLSMMIGKDINPEWNYLYTYRGKKEGVYQVAPIEDINSGRGNKVKKDHMRAILIDGSGGVGKTKVIAPYTAMMAESYLKELGKKKKIIIISPSIENVKNIEEGFSGYEHLKIAKVLTLEDFDKKSKDIKDIDKDTIFIVDEFSALEEDHINKLQKFISKSPTYIMFGDIFQAAKKTKGGALPGKGRIEVYSAIAPRINSKFRTGVRDIGAVTDAISSTILSGNIKEAIPYPFVTYTYDGLRGVRYTASAKDTMDLWKKDIRTIPEKNLTLLFAHKSEADTFKKNLDEDLKQYAGNVRWVINDTSSAEKGDMSVQGLEFDNVYVAIDDLKGVGESTDLAYIRRILVTASGRSKKFMVIPAEGTPLRLNIPSSEVKDYFEESTKEDNLRKKESLGFIADLAGKKVVNKKTKTTKEKVPKKKRKENKPSKSDSGLNFDDLKPYKDSDVEETEHKDSPLLGKAFFPVNGKIKSRNGYTYIKEVYYPKIGTLEFVNPTRIVLSDGSVYSSQEGVPALAKLKEDYGDPEEISQREWKMALESSSDIEEFDKSERDVNIYKLRRTRRIFSAARRFPVMVNVAEAKEGTAEISERDFFDNHRKTGKPLSGDYRLVWHRDKTLYMRVEHDDGTVTYKPKKAYGVLAMENREGSVVGVLPNPAQNEGEALSGDRSWSGYAEGKDESHYSNIFSEDNYEENRKLINFKDEEGNNDVALNDMNDYLLKMQTKGWSGKSDDNVLGTITIGDDIRGARPIFNDKPMKLDIQIRNFEDEGIRFRKDSKGDYFIRQMRGPDGRLYWAMEGSYLHNEGEPVFSTYLYVEPGIINDSSYEDIKRSINDLESKSDKGSEFMYDLNSNLAYQTIKTNTRLFIKNGKILPDVSSFLVYDREATGSTSVSLKGEGKGNKVIIRDLKKAVNYLNDLRAQGVEVRAWGKRNIKNDSKRNNIFTIVPDENMSTKVSDLYGPNYSGGVNLELMFNDRSTRKSSRRAGSFSSTKRTRESIEGEPLTLTSTDEAVGYIKGVLGDAYVKKFLGVKDINKITKEEGKRLLGYTTGLHMVLASMGDGFVTQQAFRHEPVHIIIDHILSRKENNDLYNAIKSYTGNKNMTRSDAWEWIATMHEKDITFKAKGGPVTIIGRILHFLKNMFFNMKRDHVYLNDFFRKIDVGYYRDVLDANSKPLYEGMRERADRSDEYKKNNIRYISLARVFGSNRLLQGATDMVLKNVKDSSSASNYLNNSFGSLSASIDNVRGNIKTFVEGHNLDMKFKDAESLDAAYDLYRARQESDDRGMTDDDIADYWALYNLNRDNNYDVVIKKLFPQSSLSSDNNREAMSRDYKEAGLKDPESYTSDVVYRFLRTIPYHEFDDVDKIAPSQPLQTYVDYDILKRRIAETMHLVSSKGELTIDRLNSVFDKLKEMANQYKMGKERDDISRNSILSFIEYFGKVKSGVELEDDLKKSYDMYNAGEKEGYPIFSHNQFAYHGDDIFKIMDELGLSDQAFRDNVIKKMRTSADLLNATMTTLNQYPVDFHTLKVVRFRGDLYYQKNLYRESSENRMKRDIRSAMNRTFYSGDGGVSDEGYQLVSSRYGINVGEKSISYGGYGTVLRKVPGGWDWVNDNVQSQTDIMRKILQTMRIRGIKDSTVYNLLQNGDIQMAAGLTRKDIASYIGNMLISVKNGHEGTYKPEIDRELKLFLKNIGVEEPDRIVKIDDFFPFINMLANIQSFITARINPNITMSVKGKAKPNLVLPNAIKDAFHNISDDNASAGIMRRGREAKAKMEQNNEWDNKNRSSLTIVDKDGKEFFTNPLIDGDEKAPMAVDYVDIVNGIQDRFIGREPRDFVASDYIDYAIHGLFKDSVLKGNGTVIDLLPENMGDSSVLPFFGVNFSTRGDKLAQVISHEGKKDFVINDKLINNYIDYAFNKSYKAYLSSIYRLADYYVTRGEKVTHIDPERPVEDQTDAIYKAHNSIRKILEGEGRSAEDVAIDMKRNGIWENNDFIYKDGKISLGFDAERNDDIYNRKNFNLWNWAKEEYGNNHTELARIRDYIFDSRLREISNLLRDKIGVIPEEIKEFGDNYYKKTDKIIVGKDNSRMIIQREYHPYYKAFYYADHIMKKFVLAPVLGDPHQYSGSIQKAKRNKLGNSSGKKPVLGGRGPQEKAHFIVLTDRKDTKSYDLMKAITGDGDYLQHESAEIVNPVYHNQIITGLGGNEFSLADFNDTTIKSVQSGTDATMDRAHQYKYAQFKLTEDQLVNTKFGQDLWHLMLTRDTSKINLYEEYLKYLYEGSSHDEAVNRLQDLIAEHPEYNDAMVAGISFESGNPSNSAVVNDISLDDLPNNNKELVYDTRDNNQVYYQLNANSEGQRELSRANQLESQIILGSENNTMRADIIDNANKAIYDIEMKDVFRGIDKLGTRDYLKKLGIQSSDNMGRITLTGELFAHGITTSLPILHEVAMQALASKVNLAINPRSPGILAVQTPADFDLIETIDDYGNPYLTTMGDHGGSWEGLTTRKLKHIRVFDKEGKEIELSEDYHKDIIELNRQVAEANRLLREEGDNKDIRNKISAIIDKGLVKRVDKGYKNIRRNISYIKPSEVGINYPYKKEFGIGEIESLDNVFTMNVDGKKLHVKAWLKANMDKAGKNYYNKQQRRDFITNQFADFLKGKDVSARNITDADDIASYYKGFIDTLFTHSERVPTTGFASASADEIVLFTPHSGNRIYISPERNKMSNADFDIDELHTYFLKPFVDDRGRPSIRKVNDPSNISSFINETRDRLDNLKHDMITDAYLDPDNIDQVLSSVDLGELRDFVNEKRVRHADFNETVNTFMATREGKKMVSRFANAVHSYTALKRIGPEVTSRLGLDDSVLRESIPSYDVIRRQTETIANNLFKNLQGAVDNPKEMVLGFLNINEASGNMVAAMILSGKPLNEIVDILTDNVVDGVIKDVMNSQGVRKTSKNILDALDEKINILQQMFIEPSSEKVAIKEMKRRLDYTINKLLAEKDETLADKLIYKEGEFDQWKFSLDELNKGVEDIKEKAVKMAEEKRMKFIEGEVATLRDRLTSVKENVREYNQTMKDKAETAKEKLLYLKDMYYRGQFVFRFSRGLSLYTGLPSTNWDRYLYTNQLEDIFGQSLDNFLKGKKNYGGWKRYADLLPGQDIKDFTFTSGHAIKKYADDLATQIRNKISNKGDFIFMTTGSEGFDSNIARALSQGNVEDNFKVEQYTTADGTILNANGRRLHPAGDYQKGKARGSGSLKYELAKKADVAIHIDATTGHINRIEVAGKEVTYRANRKEPDFDKIINKIKKYQNDRGEPITVSITGSDEFTLCTQPMTEYARYLDEEAHIRSFGNIAELYHRLPDVETYVNALDWLNKQGEEAWFNTPFIESFRKDIAKRNIRKWLTAKEYVSFGRAMGDVVLSMYYRDNNFLFNFDKYFNEGNRKIDLSKDVDRNYFLYLLPEVVRRILNDSSNPLSKNLFLNHLTEANGILVFDKSFSENEEALQKAFYDLGMLGSDGKELQQALVHYDILYRGFSGLSYGTWRNYIDPESYRSISDYIKAIEPQFQGGKEGKILKGNMRQYFTTNVLNKYHELVRYHNEQNDPWIAEGMNPEYIKTYERLNRYRSREVVMRWDPKRGEYVKVDYTGTRKLSAMPVDHNMETEREVVRLNDVHQFEVLRSNNRIITKRFDSNHAYPARQDVVVGDTYGELISNGPRSIRIILDDNPGLDRNLEMKEGAAKASTTYFLDALNLDTDIFSEKGLDKFIEERNGKLYYDPVKFLLQNPMRNLNSLNAIILKEVGDWYGHNSKGSYDDLVSMADKYGYKRNASDLEAVGKLIKNEGGLVKDKNDLAIVDDARDRLLHEYAIRLTGNSSVDLTLAKINEGRSEGSKYESIIDAPMIDVVKSLRKDIKDNPDLGYDYYDKIAGFWEQRMSNLDRISDETAQDMLAKAKKQFGIDGEVISIDRAREILGKRNVPIAFSYDGVSYVVKGRAHADTPLHEALHPFVDALEKVNKTLYDSLVKQVLSTAGGRLLYDDLSYEYDMSDEDLNKELLTTYMGRSAAYRWLGLKENKSLLKRFWEALQGMFHKVFGADIGKLNPDMTLGELVHKIARGDKILFDRVNDGKVWEQRKIKDSNELLDNLLLRPKDVGKSVTIERKKENRDVSWFANNIMKSKKHSIDLYDPETKNFQTYDFSKEAKLGYETVAKEVRKQLIPKLAGRDNYYADKIIAWANSGSSENGFAQDDEATIKKFFVTNRRRHFNTNVIKKFKTLLNHNPQTKLIHYKDLKGMLKGSSLESAFDESVAGVNPLIVIHHLDRTLGTMDATIMNLSFRGEGNEGINKTNLLINFGVSDKDAIHEGLYIRNNLSNARSLQLMLLAMKMKHAGVNVFGIQKVFMTQKALRVESVDPLLYSALARKLGEVAILGDKLSSILADYSSDVTDVIDYNLMLRHMIRDRLLNNSLSSKAIKLYENDLDVVDRYLNHEGNDNEYIAMLEQRRRWLDEHLQTMEERASNSEYVTISEILGELKSGFKRDPFRKVHYRKDLNIYDRWASAIHDQQNEVLQDFYGMMRSKSAEINGTFYNTYKTELKGWIDKLRPIWEDKFGKADLFKKGYMSETFHKVFEPLIMKTTLPGTDGKRYEVSLHKLYTEWDSKAKSKGIRKEEIDFANWVADVVEKNIKSVIRQETLKTRSTDYWSINKEGERVLDEKALEDAVNEKYNTYWERGMLPVMYKTPNMNLFEGSFSKFIGKWAKRGSANVEMFDEVMDLVSSSESGGNVRSHFSSQYSYGVPTEAGSEHRMRLLGLEYDGDGNMRVKVREKDDVDKTDGLAVNKDVNTNIEDILDFFVSDAMWKVGMENDIIPEFSSALVRLRTSELLYGYKQNYAKQHLDIMFKRVIQGERILEFDSPMYAGIATGLNAIQKLTSFSGVAFSIPVGITSGIGNLTELNLHAFATSIGDPNDLFGAGQLHKGVYEMVTNINKVNALTKMYQITEMERWDMVANQRYKLTKNSPMSYRTPQWLNWITDYSVRQLVMVAQMIHDGTWEAHEYDSKTDAMKYNAYKDKRFYSYKDGKYVQTEEQKALMNWLRRDLLRDSRIPGQKDSKLPLRAYDAKDERKFEFIASHFVTGTYNQESTGAYDSFIIGRLMAQFKKYLISKAEIRLGGLENFRQKGVVKTKVEGGRRAVIRLTNGKLVERWIPFETNGAYTEVFKWMYHDVLVPLFTGHKEDLMYRWKDLTPLQKYSMARSMEDAAMFFSLYTLYEGIGKMAYLTDEQKKRYNGLVNMRIIRALQHGWQTALAMTPKQLTSTLGIPAWENLKRLINLATFNGTSSDLRRVLPFGASVDSFTSLMNYVENK